MTIGEGIGATLAFGTSFTSNILSIEPPDWEVTMMDTTHLGTTGGFKTRTAAALAEPGEVTVTAQYDTATAIPVLGETDTLTITFPDTQEYAGEATVTTVTPSSPAVDELLTIAITFSFTGGDGTGSGAPTENWGTP